MILLLIASIFLFSCAEKVQYKNVYVPVKCQVPEIEEPQYIKPSENANYPEILKTLLENYRMCKVYSEKLKQSQEVCK